MTYGGVKIAAGSFLDPVWCRLLKVLHKDRHSPTLPPIKEVDDRVLPQMSSKTLRSSASMILGGRCMVPPNESTSVLTVY